MITFVELGEKSDKTPLIAVPGIDGSIGSVKPVVEGLAKSRKVYVADYTGEENDTLEGLSQEIANAIDDEISGSFHLLGQSIGSIAAAQLATDYELPVKQVALMCTFTKLNWTQLRISNFFMRLTPNWLYRLTTRPVMAYVCGPVLDGDDHPFFWASRNSDKSKVIKRTAWQIDRDFTPDLNKIQRPLLVLMGKQDRFVPDAEQEIKKLSGMYRMKQDASVEAIAEAGHVFLPSHAINLAIQRIDDFLS